MHAVIVAGDLYSLLGRVDSLPGPGAHIVHCHQRFREPMRLVGQVLWASTSIGQPISLYVRIEYVEHEKPGILWVSIQIVSGELNLFADVSSPKSFIGTKVELEPLLRIHVKLAYNASTIACPF